MYICELTFNFNILFYYITGGINIIYLDYTIDTLFRGLKKFSEEHVRLAFYFVQLKHEKKN